jgi:hypothetical protein
MLELISNLIQSDNSLFFIPLNALVAILSFIVAWVYGKKAFLTKNPDTRILALGIASTAGGLGIQRSYWTVVRAITTNHPELVEILYQHWSWITYIPLLIVIFGYSKHLQLIICEKFGKFSFWKYILLLIGIYFILLFGFIYIII